MRFEKIEQANLFLNISLSHFENSTGIKEFHAMLEGNNPLLDALTQYQNIEQGIALVKEQTGLSNVQLVWKRYFVSDAINHAPLINNLDKESAISIVQQPSLKGSKVAAWIYLVEDVKGATDTNGAFCFEHGDYKHIYHTQFHSHKPDEYTQTEELFNNYSKQLATQNCTLKDNAIRTWIYCQGVDTHYAGMVEARKKYFINEGLTEQTHYIASTGIEGKYLHPETIVLMDAYSIAGIAEEQVVYIKGLSHLNPTCEYGVTFERATAVDYGDRRHIFVSGTASIDNKGDIVHLLQIEQQIERTIENIEVLLQEANAQMNDIAQMIVYLRDTADYVIVNNYMETHFAHLPKLIVWAPVCRPGWLIEIECIAITNKGNSTFGKF